MDVGPDGSLCRLTSSFANVECNVKIVRVLEEESNGVDYKLVLIKETKNDCESASEKSDEELTLESLDIELGISKPENAKDKTEVTADKPINKNSENKPFNKKFRPNNANRHRKNYTSPSQRNFKPYNSGNKPYMKKPNSTDTNDIYPWLDPPLLMNTVENYPYGNYPQYVSLPVLDSSLNTSVGSNIDPPQPRSRGILGNSPYDRLRPKFQMVTNANHFSREPNYWNEDYSNNYQHPVQNASMRHKSPFKKHNNQKFWKNGPKFYNRNQNNNQKRRGRGRHFYRQEQ